MSAQATYPIFTSREGAAYDFAAPDMSHLTVEEAATSLARLYRWRGDDSPSRCGDAQCDDVALRDARTAG